MACCGKARARAKKVAIKKATVRANQLNKLGKVATPKPAKIKPTKVPAAKVKPCKLCGKAAKIGKAQP